MLNFVFQQLSRQKKKNKIIQRVLAFSVHEDLIFGQLNYILSQASIESPANQVT